MEISKSFPTAYPTYLSGELPIKSLKKLTNLKLFKKFLTEESHKSNNKSIVKASSPKKNPVGDVSVSKVEQSIQTPIEISLESSRVYSDHSEIQGFSQHIFASSPDKQYLQYYPMYMPYSIDPYKEAHQEKLKDDAEKPKSEFIQLLNEKEAEISKLKKQLESSQLDVMELEDKIRDYSVSDTQELEKKINFLVEQNQKLLESNRMISNESRAKCNEIEAELRSLKQRNEEVLKDYYKEKEKNDSLELRMNIVKERTAVLENSTIQLQDRVMYLERELDAAYREKNTLNKRGFNDREEYFDYIPNTARNFQDDYPKPRSQFVLDESFNNRNSRQSSNLYPEPSKEKPADKSPIQKLSLEQKLDSLICDKQRLEKEYAKQPEVCKNIASKRRKEELELELEILETNIQNIRSKIRNRPR
jgi:hypothetical protein